VKKQQSDTDSDGASADGAAIGKAKAVKKIKWQHGFTPVTQFS
jgi:hypothetical protein